MESNSHARNALGAAKAALAALGLSLAAGAMAAGPAAAAGGDAPTVDLGASVPAAKDIDEGLFPDDACEDLKAHGFKCMGFKPAVRFTLPASDFRIGSAELPDGLRHQLDVFGQVLKTKSGTARKVRIEGHADATGTADSNERLSTRRAEAARDYLVSKGVAPDLLVPVGVGSTDLADPGNPKAAKNRRVVIGRNIAPQ